MKELSRSQLGKSHDNGFKGRWNNVREFSQPHYGKVSEQEKLMIGITSLHEDVANILQKRSSSPMRTGGGLESYRKSKSSSSPIRQRYGRMQQPLEKVLQKRERESF